MTNENEHYAEAQRFLRSVTLDTMHPDGSPVVRQDEISTIAVAQVHATLAVAEEIRALTEAVTLVPGAMP